MQKLIFIMLVTGSFVSCSRDRNSAASEEKGAVTAEARRLGVGESFEVKTAKTKNPEARAGNVSAEEVNGVPQLTVDAFPE